MVPRGDPTTRDRDFADVLLLAPRGLDAANLSDAIAAFRQVELCPISDALVTLGRDGHWRAPAGPCMREPCLTATIAI
jgi:hypothetical protein